jgi:hypothetical protein
MRKLLVVLVLLASSVAYAAEPIEYNGKKGVFIEDSKAKELLEKVGVELPAAKKKNELLEQQVQEQKDLIDVLEVKLKNEEEISAKWKEIAEICDSKEDDADGWRNIYIGVGAALLVGGLIVGAGATALTMWAIPSGNG